MTQEQMTLFDARAARDAGMAQVEAAADDDWNDYAWHWLLWYLRYHREFFPDDVWAAGLTEPRERRAFGPLVLRAARAGYIVKTEQTRQRTRGHATRAVVWRSRLFDVTKGEAS